MATTHALDDEYAISAAQRAQFQRDGHILLRGVCTPDEAARFREAITAAVHRHKPDLDPLEERDTYGKAFIQTMNLWVDDDAVKAFVLSRRFAKIAADLLGVEGIRLYHDQALYKEPGGGHTPWHQDHYYWPLDTADTITMWMPLVDITPDMGVMEFANGSHKDGNLSDIEISDESQDYFANIVGERGYTRSTPEPMRAGDVTFHNGWTLHNATPNSTGTMREVMTIIYYADGAKIIEPGNPGQVADLATWLPGCQPGDNAVSPLNPLLYP